MADRCLIWISERVTAVTADAVGNIIEWYDFALCGLMAAVLAGLFSL